MSDTVAWVPKSDGFAYGDVAVFPFHFGCWEVWARGANGDFDHVNPPIIIKARETREATIEAAKAAALDYMRRTSASQ